jgi:phospholipase C
VRWFVEHENDPFDFTTYGMRVPTIVVSPWVERGFVDKVTRDHTSIVATVRRLFGPDVAHLTERDRAANDLVDLLTTSKHARYPKLPPAPTPPAAPAAVALEARTPRKTDAKPNDDLRDQLATIATKVQRRLDERNAPEPEDAILEDMSDPLDALDARFRLYTERARGA